MELDLSGLVLPERIEIAETSEDGRSAVFVLEPLERGFGYTLGNSVRRVLLSSLKGSAVWAFRIEGVVHEHQTVVSVVEDVHQIIQNLKSLVVSLDEGVDEATLTLQATTAGPVTASAIKVPGSVTIHDPDHHILTLEGDHQLNIELYVRQGRGFVLADQSPLPKDPPVDFVRIDAIYNPVLRANFTVEETRVGQRTDFDRLSIHVETDGSVDPEAAIRYSAELVRKHLEYLLYFSTGGLPDHMPPPRAPVPEAMIELFATAIEDVAGISVRARNSLQRESIKTLGDLIRRSEEEIINIDNFGKKSLKEMQQVLEDRGLRFGMTIEEGDDGRLYFVREKAVEPTGE